MSYIDKYLLLMDANYTCFYSVNNQWSFSMNYCFWKGPTSAFSCVFFRLKLLRGVFCNLDTWKAAIHPKSDTAMIWMLLFGTFPSETLLHSNCNGQKNVSVFFVFVRAKRWLLYCGHSATLFITDPLKEFNLLSVVKMSNLFADTILIRSIKMSPRLDLEDGQL